MHYRVIRDDQEYGPYTIEEITQYVQEGSILPKDYVHNGMEWNGCQSVNSYRIPIKLKHPCIQFPVLLMQHQIGALEIVKIAL